MEFITANLGTIIVGVVVLAIVALIVKKMINDKKKGGCATCDGCSGCPSLEQEE